MTWWQILLIALIAFVLLWLGISLVCYFMVFFNLHKKERPFLLPPGEQYQKDRKRMRALIEEMAAIESESLTIGKHRKLYARYYHIDDNAPLQIQVHGYKGSAIRDFCGGNKLAREMGHNTLVIDQRAHGKSFGRTIAFGEKECKDVKRWAEYMANRLGRDTPMILSGVSMGAATVLLCSGMEIEANIVGIIADSPFSSSAEIIAKVAKDMGFPPKAVMPFIKAGARMFGGLKLDVDVCAEVKKATVPILIIHGEDDRFVPCDMSRDIYAAAPLNIELETFAGAGHGLSFIEDFDRYQNKVCAFVSQIIKDTK